LGHGKFRGRGTCKTLAEEFAWAGGKKDAYFVGDANFEEGKQRDMGGGATG